MIDADKVVFMSDGRMIQVGDVEHVFGTLERDL